MPRTLQFLCCLLVAQFVSPFVNLGFGQTTNLIEFSSLGKKQTGMTLIEFAQEMVVLGADGSIHSLDPDTDRSIRRVEGTYQPISGAELRNDLRKEFGSGFEVIATKHFLVVQPAARGDRWPELFEKSHRTFTSYMKKRGVKVRRGRFPMVAVVFPDQKAMYREFTRRRIDVTRVAGIYSNDTNRVMTHDGGHLSLIASTVRHEAAHQSAFNSGVHSRVTATPKWITEGIGQMFESPSMTNSAANVRAKANVDSMLLIKRKLSGLNEPKFHQTVQRLIADDTLFENDKTIDDAYAVSWAMMFYLAEREPTNFAKILNHTANRPAFRRYEKKDRINDLESILNKKSHRFSMLIIRFLQSM